MSLTDNYQSMSHIVALTDRCLSIAMLSWRMLDQHYELDWQIINPCPISWHWLTGVCLQPCCLEECWTNIMSLTDKWSIHAPFSGIDWQVSVYSYVVLKNVGPTLWAWLTNYQSMSHIVALTDRCLSTAMLSWRVLTDIMSLLAPKVTVALTDGGLSSTQMFLVENTCNSMYLQWVPQLFKHLEYFHVNKSCKIVCCDNKTHQIIQNMILS